MMVIVAVVEVVWLRDELLRNTLCDMPCDAVCYVYLTCIVTL